MREKLPELLTAMQWLVSQEAGTSFTFVPTVDHKFLTNSPLQLINGEFQRKDILLGANSHEGSMFVILTFPNRFDPTKDYNANVTSEEYREMVEQLKIVNSSSDLVIDTIASIYLLPCDHNRVNYFMALDRMLGDVWFNCPILHMARPYDREVI